MLSKRHAVKLCFCLQLHMCVDMWSSRQYLSVMLRMIQSHCIRVAATICKMHAPFRPTCSNPLSVSTYTSESCMLGDRTSRNNCKCTAAQLCLLRWSLSGPVLCAQFPHLEERKSGRQSSSVWTKRLPHWKHWTTHRVTKPLHLRVLFSFGNMDLQCLGGCKRNLASQDLQVLGPQRIQSLKLCSRQIAAKKDSPWLIVGSGCP